MITQDYLKSKLNYNAETGIFTWKVNANRRLAKTGDVAGGLNNLGYHRITLQSKTYLSHRLAWLYVYGYMPKVIDHINGNPSDNRICNLRIATFAENSFNAKLSSKNKTGLKGICWNKFAKKWMAYIRTNNENNHLGYFDDFFNACCAIFSERNKAHGDFAKFK